MFPHRITRPQTPPQECAVCLDAMQCGHVTRELTCGHEFHAGCIDRWVLQTAATAGGAGCPLCKTGVFPKANEGFEVVYDDVLVSVGTGV